MSDTERIDTSDLQVLTAEYKDGHLQIVEVTPFDKGDLGEQSTHEVTHILPELNYEESDGQPKYMQVLDSSNKSLVELDLLNLTLVRSEDGEESYQFITNENCVDGNDISSDGDTTVTCVLQSSDNEIDHDNQESYVLVDNQNGQGPLVFLQSSLQQANVTKKEEPKKKSLTPAEILEKAKALQKAKAIMSKPNTDGRRKRKSDLPPAYELLASPNFKLYLYSCKLCSFKCNAIREMSAHKAAEHGGNNKSKSVSSRAQPNSGRGLMITLQCARCPFRGISNSQLIKHVQDEHLKDSNANNTVHLDTEEVEAADVLVCGACGFESVSRHLFRLHIENVHGATTC